MPRPPADAATLPGPAGRRAAKQMTFLAERAINRLAAPRRRAPPTTDLVRQEHPGRAARESRVAFRRPVGPRAALRENSGSRRRRGDRFDAWLDSVCESVHFAARASASIFPGIDPGWAALPFSRALASEPAPRARAPGP